MASGTSWWGSKEEEEVTIQLALVEQHLAGPEGCQPGEDSPGVAAGAPPGPVRSSRQAQPGGADRKAGGKLKVENSGQ